AFAVWDRRSETLFLARDRLGVKPLYYGELTTGEIIFSSELKALQRHPRFDRNMDPAAAEDYFCFGYIPDPKTIFKGARKLAPAHFLLAKRGAALPPPRRYWDVPLSDACHAEAQAENQEEELRQRLLESVRLRLVSDVPLGAFLSGGIDSSAVVAMMRDLGTEDLLTCSFGFQEKQ